MRPQPRVSELRLPMQFRLVFARSVPLSEAREAARKLLDALELEADAFCAPEPLEQASVTCANLRRTLTLYDKP